MFRRRGKAPRRSELTAFIDEGSEIEGRYTFRGTVMLNGKFKGEISSNDTLIIGERAVLQADIRAGRLVVNGEVTGNLSATERIELKRTARVYGDVEAPVVVVYLATAAPIEHAEAELRLRLKKNPNPMP